MNRPLNLTYCWAGPSAYLAACLAELSRRTDVNARLLTFGPDDDAPYDMDMLSADHCHILPARQRRDYRVVRDWVVGTKPDVVVFSGWSIPPFVRLTTDPALAPTKFVLASDAPLRFDFRQWIATLKIGGLLRRVDAVIVPGERGFQLMRYWRVPGEKITRLCYGIDFDAFAGPAAERWSAGCAWPKRFLFAGRYVPIKGIDTLTAAYEMYREAVDDPWPLTTCGTGPLKHLLAGVPGVEDRGFVQPAGLPEVFAEAGVFVLPSRLDPWGQVIVEAAAAGLPIICTQACGAAAENVRDYHNGLLVPAEAPRALARAMAWMHEHYGDLPRMGRESQHLASAYSAERWADNQIALARRLMESPPPR